MPWYQWIHFNMKITAYQDDKTTLNWLVSWLNADLLLVLRLCPPTPGGRVPYLHLEILPLYTLFSRQQNCYEQATSFTRQSTTTFIFLMTKVHLKISLSFDLWPWFKLQLQLQSHTHEDGERFLRPFMFYLLPMDDFWIVSKSCWSAIYIYIHV